jgi:hypothetical protein
MNRAVYRVHDTDNRLLYVCSSSVPRQRLGAHFRAGSPFAPYARLMTIEWFDNTAGANATEQTAHYTEAPVFPRPVGRARGPAAQFRLLNRPLEDDYVASHAAIPGNPAASVIIHGHSQDPGLRHRRGPVPTVVTTPGAARTLGITRATLIRWAKAGYVKPISTTLGGHRRWSLTSLRKQIEEFRPR